MKTVFETCISFDSAIDNPTPNNTWLFLVDQNMLTLALLTLER